MGTKKQTVDTLTIRKIACEIPCDPRSVAKVLAGGHVRGLAGERIRAALEAKGLR